MAEVLGYVNVIKRSGKIGSRYPVTGDCLIGSGYHCEIRIHLENVATEHCLIQHSGNGKCCLKNLSTHLPTVLNGSDLKESAILYDGDTFSVLDRSFRWEYSEIPSFAASSNIMTSRSLGEVGPRRLIAVVSPQVREKETVENTARHSLPSDTVPAHSQDRDSLRTWVLRRSVGSTLKSSKRMTTKPREDRRRSGLISDFDDGEELPLTPVSRNPKRKVDTDVDESGESRKRSNIQSYLNSASTDTSAMINMKVPAPRKSLHIDDSDNDSFGNPLVSEDSVKLLELDKARTSEVNAHQEKSHRKSLSKKNIDSPLKRDSLHPRRLSSRSTKRLTEILAKKTKSPGTFYGRKLLSGVSKTTSQGRGMLKTEPHFISKRKSLSKLDVQSTVVTLVSDKTGKKSASPKNLVQFQKAVSKVVHPPKAARHSVSLSPSQKMASAKVTVHTVAAIFSPNVVSSKAVNYSPKGDSLTDTGCSNKGASPKSMGRPPKGTSPRNIDQPPKMASPRSVGRPPKVASPRSVGRPPKVATPRSVGRPPKVASPRSVGRPPKVASPRSVGRPPKVASPRSVGRPPKEASPRSVGRPPKETSPRSVGRSPKEASPRSVGRQPKVASPRSVGRPPKEASPKSVGRLPKVASPRSVGRLPKEASPRSVGQPPKEASPRSVGRQPKVASPRSVGRPPKEASPRSVGQSPKGTSPKLAVSSPRVVSTKATVRSPKVTSPKAVARSPKVTSPKAVAHSPKVRSPKAVFRSPKTASPNSSLVSPTAASPKAAVSFSKVPTSREIITHSVLRSPPKLRGEKVSRKSSISINTDTELRVNNSCDGLDKTVGADDSLASYKSEELTDATPTLPLHMCKDASFSTVGALGSTPEYGQSNRKSAGLSSNALIASCSDKSSGKKIRKSVGLLPVNVGIPGESKNVTPSMTPKRSGRLKRKSVHLFPYINTSNTPKVNWSPQDGTVQTKKRSDSSVLANIGSVAHSEDTAANPTGATGSTPSGFGRPQRKSAGLLVTHTRATVSKDISPNSVVTKSSEARSEKKKRKSVDSLLANIGTSNPSNVSIVTGAASSSTPTESGRPKRKSAGLLLAQICATMGRRTPNINSKSPSVIAKKIKTHKSPLNHSSPKGRVSRGLLSQERRSEIAAKKLKMESPKTPDKKKMAALLQCHKPRMLFSEVVKANMKKANPSKPPAYPVSRRKVVAKKRKVQTPKVEPRKLKGSTGHVDSPETIIIRKPRRISTKLQTVGSGASSLETASLDSGISSFSSSSCHPVDSSGVGENLSTSKQHSSLRTHTMYSEEVKDGGEHASSSVTVTRKSVSFSPAPQVLAFATSDQISTRSLKGFSSANKRRSALTSITSVESNFVHAASILKKSSLSAKEKPASLSDDKRILNSENVTNKSPCGYGTPRRSVRLPRNSSEKMEAIEDIYEHDTIDPTNSPFSDNTSLPSQSSTSFNFDLCVTPSIPVEKFVSPSTASVTRNQLNRNSYKRDASSLINELKDTSPRKKLMKAFHSEPGETEVQKSPGNDLTKEFSSPVQKKSPVNDLTNVSGVRGLRGSIKKQVTPKNDLSDLRGVRRLMTTPKVHASPENSLTDVTGVRKLFKTPVQARSPKNDLTDVRGVRKLLSTPKDSKSPKNDLTDVRGVRKLMTSPKIYTSPENNLSDVVGVRKLFRSPSRIRSPKNDITDVRGVKKLLSTPKEQKSPKNDLTDVRGVRKLMTTPRIHKSPENNLSDVTGVQKLFRSPAHMRSPKNDLSDVRGVRKLLSTPKERLSPKNDLTDVRGVRELLGSPIKQNLLKNDPSDVEGVKSLLKSPSQETKKPIPRGTKCTLNEKVAKPEQTLPVLECGDKISQSVSEMLPRTRRGKNKIIDLAVEMTSKTESVTSRTRKRLNQQLDTQNEIKEVEISESQGNKLDIVAVLEPASPKLKTKRRKVIDEDSHLSPSIMSRRGRKLKDNLKTSDESSATNVISDSISSTTVRTRRQVGNKGIGEVQKDFSRSPRMKTLIASTGTPAELENKKLINKSAERVSPKTRGKKKRGAEIISQNDFGPLPSKPERVKQTLADPEQDNVKEKEISAAVNEGSAINDLPKVRTRKKQILDQAVVTEKLEIQPSKPRGRRKVGVELEPKIASDRTLRFAEETKQPIASSDCTDSPSIKTRRKRIMEDQTEGIATTDVSNTRALRGRKLALEPETDTKSGRAKQFVVAIDSTKTVSTRHISEDQMNGTARAGTSDGRTLRGRKLNDKPEAIKLTGISSTNHTTSPPLKTKSRSRRLEVKSSSVSEISTNQLTNQHGVEPLSSEYLEKQAVVKLEQLGQPQPTSELISNTESSVSAPSNVQTRRKRTKDQQIVVENTSSLSTTRSLRSRRKY